MTADRTPAQALAHGLIRGYQVTLSGVVGRQCRHLPTCSDFTDEAITRHGFWAGGWMGLARMCRCHPWGTDGYDPVPDWLPSGAGPARPWRYGVWTPAGLAQDRAMRSTVSAESCARSGSGKARTTSR